MSNTNQFTTTYPVYKNAKGNTYACGRADGEKNSAFQIKDGQIKGAGRTLNFIDMDFIGTITVKYYDGKTITKTF